MSAAPALEDVWYVRVGTETFGPYPAARLSTFITEGRVKASTQIAPDPQGPFAPARDTASWADQFAPRPVGPTPSPDASDTDDTAAADAAQTRVSADHEPAPQNKAGTGQAPAHVIATVKRVLAEAPREEAVSATPGPRQMLDAAPDEAQYAEPEAPACDPKPDQPRLDTGDAAPQDAPSPSISAPAQTSRVETQAASGAAALSQLDAQADTGPALINLVIVVRHADPTLSAMAGVIDALDINAVPAAPGVWFAHAKTTAHAVRNALSRHVGPKDILIVVDTSRDDAAWFNVGAPVDAALRALRNPTGARPGIAR